MTVSDEPPTTAKASPNSAALPPCVVITGPTGAGKTRIALSLARALPVYLVSIDSVQVYRGMDIGSAKLSSEMQRRFPHALIDIRDPDQAYSVADFLDDARAEIKKARDSGKLPVLVGGTTLYLRALRYGLDPMPGADPEIRNSIEREAESLGWAKLHRRLAAIDPIAAAGIRVNDPQRIQRALEIYRTSGRPASSFWSGRGEDRMIGSLMIVGRQPATGETPNHRLAAMDRRILV
ncbi:MAG: tRNA (adenosine(37)-N6)-dimethylallyltransferase MiaA [Xanthomonadaceae bacterium]|nr:tRNA (adenosine(37)-N6)-dimethylallyltransferase MiaA [Xanthomonadaceae bacterium]